MTDQDMPRPTGNGNSPPVDDRMIRVTQFYWKEMFELKAQCIYHRLHRDDQARWGTRIGFIKAVATSTTIAGWAIWQSYAIIWGAIIAASQLIDALKEVFPYAKSRKASTDMANALDVLFIDARIEFEKILFRNITPDDASVSLRKLQKLRHDAESKHFPEGMTMNSALQSKAKQQTEVFFSEVYGSAQRSPHD